MKKYILTGLLVFQAISLVLAQGPVKKTVAPVITNPPIKILDTTTRHGPMSLS